MGWKRTFGGKSKTNIFLLIFLVVIVLIGFGVFKMFSNDYLTLKEFKTSCFESEGAFKGIYENNTLLRTECYCLTGEECQVGNKSAEILCSDENTCFQDGIGNPFHGICRNTQNPIIYHNKMRFFSC